MPQRTKKQKLRASTRRLEVSSYGVVSYKQNISQAKLPPGNNNESSLVLGTIEPENQSVLNDLVKIGFLAALIIGLQLLIKFFNLKLF